MLFKGGMTVTEEMEFFIFLLEMYAQSRGTTADKVLARWDKLNITEAVYNMYERYHCEALENAFCVIELMEEERTNAVK